MAFITLEPIGHVVGGRIESETRRKQIENALTAVLRPPRTVAA